MSTELKPCPFCREIDLNVINECQNSYVTCLACNAVGPVVIGGDNLAISAWNRRTAPVSAPLETNGEAIPLPPPKYPQMNVLIEGIRSEQCGYTAEQVRQAQCDAIAPYAERICHLERELENWKESNRLLAASRDRWKDAAGAAG